jgi:hypothetical protein
LLGKGVRWVVGVEGMEGRCLGDGYNGGRMYQSGRALVCREELGICALMRHGFVRDGGHMKGFAHV